MTLASYVKQIWKDRDSPTNPATSADPYLNATNLNSKEDVIYNLVNAVQALQAAADFGVDDVKGLLASYLQSGSGMSIAITDKITISTTITQFTSSQALDAVNAALTLGTQSGISFNYDPILGKLSATVNAPVTTVAGKSGNVTLTKADVGLDRVNNTNDSEKPVPSSVTTALNLKANKWQPAGGIIDDATAGSNQIVPIDTTNKVVTLTAPTDGSAFGARWNAGPNQPIIKASTGYTIRGQSQITMGGPVGELVTWDRFGTDYQSTGGEKSKAALDSFYAPKASPTLTGTMNAAAANFSGAVALNSTATVSANPSTALGLVPKQYVDALIAALPPVPITSTIANNAVVNNSTSLVSTGLSMTLPIGWWAIDGWFSYSSNTTAALRVQFNNNTNNSYVSMALYNPTGTSGASSIDTHVLAGNNYYGASGDNALAASAIPHGVVFVTAQDTITVTFAQLTANASNTIMYGGSWLRAQKIA